MNYILYNVNLYNKNLSGPIVKKYNNKCKTLLNSNNCDCDCTFDCDCAIDCDCVGNDCDCECRY
ncbi:MAG: hypothetical protein PHU32_06255 [Candidatus ainarchaeum sp.]|jgi:hypothetical protein|nr:hypothetical protein [Candidatus ainarchaeum sp.]